MHTQTNMHGLTQHISPTTTTTTTPPSPFQDLEEREARRSAAAKDSQWQQFIAASRPHVARQV